RCSKRAPYFQTVRPYHFPRDHTIDGSAAGASTLSLPAPCPLASAWLHRPSDRVSDGGELALFLGSFNTPLEGIRTLHPRDAWPRTRRSRLPAPRRPAPISRPDSCIRALRAFDPSKAQRLRRKVGGGSDADFPYHCERA